MPGTVLFESGSGGSGGSDSSRSNDDDDRRRTRRHLYSVPEYDSSSGSTECDGRRDQIKPDSDERLEAPVGSETSSGSSTDKTSDSSTPDSNEKSWDDRRDFQQTSSQQEAALDEIVVDHLTRTLAKDDLLL